MWSALLPSNPFHVFSLVLYTVSYELPLLVTVIAILLAPGVLIQPYHVVFKRRATCPSRF